MGQSRFLVNNDSPLWELLCWKAAPSAGQRHQGEHLLCYLRSTDSGVQTGAPLLLADGPWVICLSEPQCPHPSKWQRFFFGGGSCSVACDNIYKCWCNVWNRASAQWMVFLGRHFCQPEWSGPPLTCLRRRWMWLTLSRRLSHSRYTNISDNIF